MTIFRRTIRTFNELRPTDGGSVPAVTIPGGLGADVLNTEATFGTPSLLGSGYGGGSAGLITRTGAYLYLGRPAPIDPLVEFPIYVVGASMRFRPFLGDTIPPEHYLDAQLRAYMTWNQGGLDAFLYLQVKLEDSTFRVSADGVFSEGAEYFEYDTDYAPVDPFQWLEMSWLPTGAWSVGPVGGPAWATGSMPQMPRAPVLGDDSGDHFRMSVEYNANRLATALVDDVEVWVIPPNDAEGEPDLVRRTFAP